MAAVATVVKVTGAYVISKVSKNNMRLLIGRSSDKCEDIMYHYLQEEWNKLPKNQRLPVEADAQKRSKAAAYTFCKKLKLIVGLLTSHKTASKGKNLLPWK